MKLIKINTDHYVVVDDSEIKEGDFVYDTITNTIWTWEKYTEDEIDSKYSGKVFKITHSTNIITNGMGILYLSEVKELIGEVDVEKKADEKYPISMQPNGRTLAGGVYDVDVNFMERHAYKKGYNQALEDNKDKKYTEEDIRVAIRLATTSKYDHKLEFYSEQDILQYLQPKTSWEVQIVDGKLKLK